MAAKISPSQAKNFIRRALIAVIDPPPSLRALRELWDHFDSRCAYCDRELIPGTKQSHYDHLVSKGGNRLENFVLSCAQCNEEEKLDKDWKVFLKEKASESQIFDSRNERIVTWQYLARAQNIQVDPSLIETAESAALEICTLFEQKVEDLRKAARDGQGGSSTSSSALP